MKKFAFVSRHKPTVSQVKLAAEIGVELVAVPDLDAFEPRSRTDVVALMGNPDPGAVNFSGGPFDGVVVVHGLLALQFSQAGFPVGIFNNVNRAPVGEKPQFETTQLVVVEPDNPITTAERKLLCVIAEESAVMADIAAERAADRVAR